jgi:hypothetical protein
MGTPEFDAEMNRAARHDRTVTLAKGWGATDELAEVFAASQSAKFKWDGVALTYNGKNAVDDADTKKHFTEGALKPLFPESKAPDNKEPKIPADTLAAAKAGDLTAVGRVFNILHGDQTKTPATIAAAKAALAAALAGKSDDETARDDKGRFVADDASNKKPKPGEHKNNPWHQSNFNISAQGKLLRAVGAEKAAAIAAAVGCKIGATKPNLNY